MALSSSRNNARTVQGDDATIRTLYTSHSRDVSVRPPMGWSGRVLPCRCQRASRVTRLPMFGRFRGIGTALPCPWAPPANGWPMAKAEQRSPLLQAHYRAHNATTDCPVPVHRILTASRLEPLVPFSFALRRGSAQVLTFHTRAWSSFTLPTRRMPPGISGHPRELMPGDGAAQVLTSPNPISTLLQRFACARLSRPCLPRSSMAARHAAADNS
jgi:hypothetical protein